MPKQLRAVLIAITGLIVVTFVVLAVTRKPATKKAEADAKVTMMPAPEPAVPGTPAPTPAAEQPAAGAYVDYNANLVSITPGTRILFFHAPWCPQCRALEADIKAGTIPAGVTIFKVDYDTNQSLRQKHGVTIQTTLVKLDTDGSTAKKFVAYDEPSLASLQKNLL